MPQPRGKPIFRGGRKVNGMHLLFQVREELARQQYDEVQERRNRVRGRNERAKRELVARNLGKGQEVRDERVEIDASFDFRLRAGRYSWSSPAECRGGDSSPYWCGMTFTPPSACEMSARSHA